MRIASTGQVTIPLAIRERAGLMLNTEATFEWDGDVVRIVPAKAPAGTSLGVRAVARLRGTGDVAMSTDEIMALTRGEG